MKRLPIAVWGILALLYLVLWYTSLPTHLYQLFLPLVLMLSSFFAFHHLSPPFRAIHHICVSLMLLAVVGTAYYFAFHGGDQGGVGAYLVLWYSGLGYLGLLALLLIIYLIFDLSRSD